MNVLDFVFKTLRAVLAAGLFILLTPIIIYSAFALANYNLYSHNFFSSDACKIGDKLIGSLQRDFIYNCIDVSQEKNIGGYVNFIFFMGSESDPTPNVTGHGWLAYAALKKQSDGTFLLVEYQVRGFWGNPEKVSCPAYVTNAYGAVRGLLPFADIIEHNYQVFCREGVIGSEGISVNNPQGVPLPSINSTAELYNLLGRKPEALLVARVNTNQYNNAKYIIYEGVNHKYSLLLNDCTSYVARVAHAANLYVPPRIFRPYPSDFIIGLSQDNVHQ